MSQDEVLLRIAKLRKDLDYSIEQLESWKEEIAVFEQLALAIKQNGNAPAYAKEMLSRIETIATESIG